MKCLQPIDDNDIVLGERISTGGFGAVHKAHWKNGPVAVKIWAQRHFNLLMENSAEFFEGVSLHHSLRDSRVVEWRATTQSGWLVMELADANSKSKLCGGQSDLPWHMQLHYARQAAAGLKYTHSRSPPILHSDVKSSSFLVFGDQPEATTVKIADFGNSTAFTNSKTKTIGSAVGTVEWQSPEIYHGKPNTPASDAFSFGGVLYEIVTGNHLYGVEHMAMEFAQAVVTKKKLCEKEEPCQLKGSDKGSACADEVAL